MHDCVLWGPCLLLTGVYTKPMPQPKKSPWETKRCQNWVQTEAENMAMKMTRLPTNMVVRAP